MLEIKTESKSWLKDFIDLFFSIFFNENNNKH